MNNIKRVILYLHTDTLYTSFKFIYNDDSVKRITGKRINKMTWEQRAILEIAKFEEIKRNNRKVVYRYEAR